MKMTLRWYGPGFDSVTLEQIRQIPGVSMTSLQEKSGQKKELLNSRIS